MLGILGRRAIDLAVLFLALYAFAFVPLGKRTGFEHAKAILETRAARDAGHELLGAADRLRQRLLGGDTTDTTPLPGRGAPTIPKLPRGAPSHTNAAIAPADLDRPDASQ